MSYLVFRLYGPLASWGQAAVGGDRPTGVYPTRSAIVGLLAAALGLRRSQEQDISELNQSIQVGIKQLVPSTLMRDYHTTQVPSTKRGVAHLTRKSELSVDKLNTILSSRDYRCDGLWIVAINLVNTDKYSLHYIKQSLITPAFTLYLGRKSCPLSIPLAPRIINTLDLKEALDTCFPPLTRSDKEDKLWLGSDKLVTYYWEGSKNKLGVSNTITTEPWDSPLSKVRWQFIQRIVHQCSIFEEA